MKAIILAGGYGKRLYPLTIDTPKALLKYNNQYVLDYLIKDLLDNYIKEIILISNNKFYNQFIKYKKDKNINNLIIINNNDNDDLINAIENFNICLNYIKDTSLDDILLMGSDNILNFSLKHFIDNFYTYKQDIHIMRYLETNINKIKQSMIIYNNNLIEKPNDSFIKHINYCVPPFYIFNKNILNDLPIGIFSHNASIGKLIESLSNKYSFYFHLMDGTRISL